MTSGTIERNGDWDRDRWVAFADRLLDGARRHVSPQGAQIVLPGTEGGYGRAVDGLEGFARVLLVAGFRIAGERGAGVDDLIEFCVRGIAAGVDPAAPDRWVRLTEHPQAKVEAASIALILDLTRPWVWDQLAEATQQHVFDYLAPVVGDDSYPKTNWLWFRVVVQTFLRSVGGPWSRDDIESDLALHESLRRAEGWFSDGAERSFDHYVGWALQLYPVLWSRMHGATELGGGRSAHAVEHLDRYLQDALALVGADGSPLIQGRSLIYRFAAAAPFWAGVIAEVPSSSPGLLRTAAERIVAHFESHGAPDASGLLTLGWHREWTGLAQSYSGPGSPYWAVKGLLGVSLPADHPVWASPAEPLPIETRDTVRALTAPGWIIAGTSADGIVRVVNHGTDHAIEGSTVGDSPLYSRIGYSTATSPLLDEGSWIDPLEQSVALVDADERSTHRAGMRLNGVFVDASGVGIAGSSWDAHWIEPVQAQQRHGSGFEGTPTVAGRIDVYSLVRGPWEVRLVRVESLEPGVTAVRLRIGGWAVAGPDHTSRVADQLSTATSAGVSSGIRSLLGTAEPSVRVRSDASPLGKIAAVPVLEYPVAVGDWVAAIVGLAHAEDALQASIQFSEPHENLAVSVTWPDGHTTTSDPLNPRSTTAVARHLDRAR